MIKNLLRSLVCVAAPFPLLAHGDLHRQIEGISQEILKAPDNGVLFLRRAELYHAHEEWKPAMADYAKAEEFRVDPTIIHLARGKLFLATGQSENACVELSAVIDKSPMHVDARATRARARTKVGDYPGAVADYSAAINATTRPDPEYYLERAAILTASNPPQLAAALPGLDEGIARLGAPVALALAAVEIEVRMGHFDAAVERIARAGAGAVRPEQWLVRRAEVLDLAGRQSEARAAWAQALTAIEALPPRHRHVPSTVDLETKIRQHLSIQEK